MSLLTRCPHCKTLFRVTPVQLETRAGTVRCGRCLNVFDAYEALAIDKTPALTAPAGVAATRSAAPAAQTGLNTVPVSAAPAPSPVPAVAPVTPPAFASPTASAHDSGKWWGRGAAALALLLAGQVLFTYRGELAARSAFVRTALTWVCERTGCRVSLPQRPDLVHIEASDVHMVEADKPQLIQLTATLRSYAGYDLAYPALDLVLTNATEHAVARRIFLPREYLGRTRNAGAGIPANAEITVALELDTENLNAVGYRLGLLAAPAL
jgi:predicted Zn finger-like uncharacterized protein